MAEAKNIPILELAASLSPPDRKSANHQIDYLLKENPGKRIIDLLPVIRRRFLEYVLAVAVERVQSRMKGQTNGFSMDDQVFFEGFKRSLN